MKNLTLFVLLLLISCGNPHVSTSSSKTELDQGELGADPAEPDAETTNGSNGTSGPTGCTPNNTIIPAFKTYFGANNEIIIPSEFAQLAKCSPPKVETFQTIRRGTRTRIARLGYELVHMTLKDSSATTLPGLYGNQRYSFEVESPVCQNTVCGKNRGVDSHSASSTTKDALVWNFDRPISFFGANTLDIETSPQERGKLRIFDCAANLLNEINIIYPNSEGGQKQRHFIGFVSPVANICHVSLTVGDYNRTNWTNKSGFRALAVDDFTFGKGDNQ